MKCSIKAFAIAMGLIFLSTIPVYATLFLAGDSNIFTTLEDNDVFLQNVFNGQSVANFSNVNINYTTATTTNYGVSTEITSSLLNGNDYLLFGYSQTSVSSSELSAIVDFYNEGGALFLFGEGNTGFVSLNNTVNSVLSAVGSTMSLSTTTNFDNGSFTTLTNFVGAGSYAVGVNSWTTAYTAAINIGSGQAVISGTADNGFGVAIALEEGSPVPGGSPVPEPSTMFLLGAGLIGLAGTARKKIKK